MPYFETMRARKEHELRQEKREAGTDVDHMSYATYTQLEAWLQLYELSTSAEIIRTRLQIHEKDLTGDESWKLQEAMQHLDEAAAKIRAVAREIG